MPLEKQCYTTSCCGTWIQWIWVECSLQEIPPPVVRKKWLVFWQAVWLTPPPSADALAQDTSPSWFFSCSHCTLCNSRTPVLSSHPSRQSSNTKLTSWVLCRAARHVKTTLKTTLSFEIRKQIQQPMNTLPLRLIQPLNFWHCSFEEKN